MPQNDAAATDPIAGTGSFSRLLLSGIELEDTATLDHHHRHLNHHTTTVAAPNHFPYSTHQKSPKMLCFSSVSLIPQNFTAGDTINSNISPSPPLSTTSTATTSLSSNSNIKRYMGCDYHQPITGATASPAKTTGRNTKKMRAENTPPAGHAKVKKEKLGERIAALQQMVSPYGKTDTASVLHEALGYIKFLQEQVHVLCSPYLQQHLPPPENVQEGEWCEERKKDLRSRGLCLVPVECTLHVAESNGADMWSAAHGPLPL